MCQCCLGEIKKRHGQELTDTAWAVLINQAKKKGISVSEMIESWARSLEGS
jgi:hypothetical protein